MRGQILNPCTSRYVSENSTVGKQIRAMQSIPTVLSTKPITSILQNCRKKKLWSRKRKIGVGAVGSVYLVTPHNQFYNCRYIMKVQPDDHEFRQELKSLRVLSGWKHAPKIFDIWTCNNTAYIIQERLDQNRYSKKYTYDKLKNKILPELHRRGIVYPDIHDENVMFRRSDNTVVLIDYGWALYFKTKTSTISTADVDNILSENLDRSITMGDALTWEALNLEYDYGTDKRLKKATVDFYNIPGNTFHKNNVVI